MKILASNEIITLLSALFLLLFSSFVCGKVCEKLKVPKVIGEIVGGMLVGGSGLALLAPDAFADIFKAFPEEEKILNIFYQLGLIFLMFSSGYSTDLTLSKENTKTYSLLLFGATVLPMAAGIPFIKLFENDFIGTAGNSLAFAFVFLICAAITSIPVISKIFFDIGLMNSKFSNMVLTVSTVQDLILWILLNLSTTLAQDGEFKPAPFILTTFVTIALMFSVKLLERFIISHNLQIKSNIIPVSLLIIVAAVYLLSLINVNIMYSAFISGYIVKAITPKNSGEIIKIKDFAMSFFVPIYFALVGIQLDIVNNFSIARFALFFAIAFSLEFFGTILPLFLTKLKKKTIIGLGITMNARGGPGIVLGTTAYAYNIINLEFFTVIIITTMLSSALAGFWLRKNKEFLLSEDI